MYHSFENHLHRPFEKQNFRDVQFHSKNISGDILQPTVLLVALFIESNAVFRKKALYC